MLPTLVLLLAPGSPADTAAWIIPSNPAPAPESWSAPWVHTAIQAETHDGEAEPRRPARLKRFDVSVFYSDLELGSITSDVVVPGGGSTGSVEVPDVERRRIGGKFGFGPGFIRAYAEEFADVYDLFGVGVGARGLAPLGRQGRSSVVIEYDVGFDVNFGDGDVPDGSGGTDSQDLWYIDLEGRIGVGAEFSPFVVTGGLAYSLLGGQFESKTVDEVGNFTADNFGLYFGVGHRPREVPVEARIDLHLGDIAGLVLSVGYAF